DVVLPAPGDFEVSPRVPLAAESAPGGHTQTGEVEGENGGLDPVKREAAGLGVVKCEPKEGLDALCPQPLVDAVGGDEPTGVGALEDAADDVVEVEEAGESTVVEEGGEPTGCAGLQALAGASEGAVEARVRRERWIFGGRPGREMLAAEVHHADECRAVARLKRSQEQALGTKRRRRERRLGHAAG